MNETVVTKTFNACIFDVKRITREAESSTFP